MQKIIIFAQEPGKPPMDTAKLSDIFKLNLLHQTDIASYYPAYGNNLNVNQVRRGLQAKLLKTVKTLIRLL